MTTSLAGERGGSGAPRAVARPRAGVGAACSTGPPRVGRRRGCRGATPCRLVFGGAQPSITAPAAAQVDALEGRFAQASGQVELSGAAGLEPLKPKLTALERELGPGPEALSARAAQAAAAASLSAGGADGGGGQAGGLDDAALAEIFTVLSQQTAAIVAVQSALQRAERDLTVLEECNQ